MANNEFKDINQFIEGFSRNGSTPNDYSYDGTIFGMDFEYKNRIYRITRDTVGDEEKLRKMFNKDNNSFIIFYELIKDKYPSEDVYNIEQYLGFFDSIDDLLENGQIDGVKLRDIIPSEKTIILAID